MFAALPGSANAAGTLSVTPNAGLDPSHAPLQVEVSGWEPERFLYVFQCVGVTERVCEGETSFTTDENGNAQNAAGLDYTVSGYPNFDTEADPVNRPCRTSDNCRMEVFDASLTSQGVSVPIDFDEPPTANAQTVFVQKATPQSITLSATDPDGDPLTYTLGNPPANGRLTGTPPNLTYTPTKKGFTGTDSFTFSVSDPRGWSPSSATVSISVVANRAPTISDDTCGPGTGTTVLPTVTRSFFWEDSDGPLTPPEFSIVSPPSSGTVSISGDSWTYTPTSDATSDSFTFRAFDGLLYSSPGTVVVSTQATACPRRRRFHG